jgi:hypothetical protein
LSDINSISSQLFIGWFEFIQSFPLYSSSLVEKLALDWELDVKEHWGSCIFRETLTIKDRGKIAKGEEFAQIVI